MKNVKRMMACIVAFLLLGALLLPVSADVIVPPSNLFYQLHEDECTRIGNRAYIANSETGYVYLYKSPTSSQVERSYSNGEQVRISYLYTDKSGETWGLIGTEDGWFRMSDLSLIYDSREFLAEYEAECQPYVRGSYTIEASDEKPVPLWSYPGGEQMTYDWLRWGDFTDNISLTYTDANGAVWGYMAYIYGIREVWVCLSDPHSTTVGGYAVEEHAPTLKATPVPHDEIPAPRGNMTPLIIAGVLVAVVVLATGTVILVMYVKKKNKKAQDGDT